MNKEDITLVLGASPKHGRYSNIATIMLKEYGYKVYCVGRSIGEIEGTPISTSWDTTVPIHTVTLYLSHENQEPYKEMLFRGVKRVIFNPGSENYQLMNELKERNIEVVLDCTLQMLRGGRY